MKPLYFHILYGWNYNFIQMTLSSGFSAHSDARLQTRRIPRSDQNSHTRKNLHLSDPSSNENRFWTWSDLEAKNADSCATEATHSSGANRGLQKQHDDSDTLQEELFQWTKWRSYILHDHRGRGRQQERVWLRNAQLERRPGLQYLASVPGEKFYRVYQKRFLSL